MDVETFFRDIPNSSEVWENHQDELRELYERILPDYEDRLEECIEEAISRYVKQIREGRNPWRRIRVEIDKALAVARDAGLPGGAIRHGLYSLLFRDRYFLSTCEGDLSFGETRDPETYKKLGLVDPFEVMKKRLRPLGWALVDETRHRVGDNVYVYLYPVAPDNVADYPVFVECSHWWHLTCIHAQHNQLMMRAYSQAMESYERFLMRKFGDATKEYGMRLREHGHLECHPKMGDVMYETWERGILVQIPQHVCHYGLFSHRGVLSTNGHWIYHRKLDGATFRRFQTEFRQRDWLLLDESNPAKSHKMKITFSVGYWDDSKPLLWHKLGYE